MRRKKIPPCPACGQQFENAFEAVDHLLEDKEFDPALILPNGFKLLIGSLLRVIYRHANNPSDVRKIAESTYMTLFTSENFPEVTTKIIEEMIIESSMVDLDDEIKQLLERGE